MGVSSFTYFVPKNRMEEVLLCMHLYLEEKNFGERKEEEREEEGEEVERIYDELCGAYCEVGSYSSTRDSFEKAIHLQFEDQHLWKQFALSLFNEKQYERAYLVLQQLLSKQKGGEEDPLLYMLASKLCINHLAKFEEAIDWAKKGVQVVSSTPPPPPNTNTNTTTNAIPTSSFLSKKKKIKKSTYLPPLSKTMRIGEEEEGEEKEDFFVGKEGEKREKQEKGEEKEEEEEDGLEVKSRGRVGVRGGGEGAKQFYHAMGVAQLNFSLFQTHSTWSSTKSSLLLSLRSLGRAFDLDRKDSLLLFHLSFLYALLREHSLSLSFLLSSLRLPSLPPSTSPSLFQGEWEGRLSVGGGVEGEVSRWHLLVLLLSSLKRFTQSLSLSQLLLQHFPHNIE